MLLLGINEDHNATAALVADGSVLACSSEERYTGQKNDVGYPRLAIESAFKSAGVTVRDCDYVVFAGRIQDPLSLKLKRITRYKITDYVREMHEHWKPLLIDGQPSTFWDDIQQDPVLSSADGVHYDFGFLQKTPREQWNDAFRDERRALACRHLRIPQEKVVFVDHHKAHAFYGYYAAPIDRSQKTAVVTADGWGDDCNATVSIAHEDDIREIHRTAMCNIARIYRWITLLLGMKPNEHEYKVMGLAPYAPDYIKEPARQVFRDTLVVDGLDFKWQTKPRDMYFHFRDRFERVGARFDGIAGALQQWAEELVVTWMNNILERTGASTIVFSGGLAMNIKINKLVAELPRVKDFFVAPSPGDESLAMGAAFITAHRHDEIEPLPHAYLGPASTPEETRAALKENRVGERCQLVHRPSPDQIADYLARGYALGRCIGRMEFGARALGNRSILCDPSKPENLKKINEKIKFRDFWMPFTPSILDRRADEYLVNPKQLKAPFMTIAFDSTPAAHRDLPAALHPADKTARPQIVTRAANPEYYALIEAFEQRTGVGALLNTSFNLHGKPIVRTVADALYTLDHSGLDGLILPDLLLIKEARGRE